MGSFISRNSLAAMFFLGVMMFAISSLVGSDGEDGFLMKTARGFTGESADEGNTQAAVQPAPAPVTPTPVSIEEADSSFYDDADLIDPASGFNPSSITDPSAGPEAEPSEVLILPGPPKEGNRDAVPAAGMLVGSGGPVLPRSDDEDD